MPYHCITGSQTTEGQNVQEEITFIHNKKYKSKNFMLHRWCQSQGPNYIKFKIHAKIGK